MRFIRTVLPPIIMDNTDRVTIHETNDGFYIDGTPCYTYTAAMKMARDMGYQYYTLVTNGKKIMGSLLT